MFVGTGFSSWRGLPSIRLPGLWLPAIRNACKKIEGIEKCVVSSFANRAPLTGVIELVRGQSSGLVNTKLHPPSNRVSFSSGPHSSGVCQVYGKWNVGIRYRLFETLRRRRRRRRRRVAPKELSVTQVISRASSSLRRIVPVFTFIMHGALVGPLYR